MPSIAFTIHYLTAAGEQPADKPCVADTSGYTLTTDDLPELSVSGYVFEGWKTDNEILKVGDTVEVGNGSVTFTAVWAITDPIQHVRERQLVSGAYTTIYRETDAQSVRVDNREMLSDHLTDMDATLNNKVDKEPGMGLSANNFTDAEKEKLAGIAEGAALTGVKGNSESNYRTGNVNITPANIGLGNVPNVATNDQTPTYTEASTLAELVSGEKLNVAFGKLAKGIADLIAHLADTTKHITAADTADTAKSLIETMPKQYISATQPEIWKNLDTWLREVG